MAKPIKRIGIPPKEAPRGSKSTVSKTGGVVKKTSQKPAGAGQAQRSHLRTISGAPGSPVARSNRYDREHYEFDGLNEERLGRTPGGTWKRQPRIQAAQQPQAAAPITPIRGRGADAVPPPQNVEVPPHNPELLHPALPDPEPAAAEEAHEAMEEAPVASDREWSDEGGADFWSGDVGRDDNDIEEAERTGGKRSRPVSSSDSESDEESSDEDDDVIQHRSKRRREGEVAEQGPVVAQPARESVNAARLHAILTEEIKFKDVPSEAQINEVLLNPEIDDDAFNQMLHGILMQLNDHFQRQLVDILYPIYKTGYKYRWTKGIEYVDDKILDFIDAIQNQPTFSKWNHDNKALAIDILSRVDSTHQIRILEGMLKLVDSTELARKAKYLYPRSLFISSEVEKNLREALNKHLPDDEQIK